MICISEIGGPRFLINVIKKYSLVVSGIVLEYLMQRLSPVVKQILMAAIVGVLVYSFVLFSPLAYGMSGPSANEKNSTLYGLRWLDSWEF